MGLVFANDLNLKLKVEDDCPVTEDDLLVSVRRKLSSLDIPVSTSGKSIYTIRIRAQCLGLPDGTVIYSGNLDLDVPVLLPSTLASEDTGTAPDFKVLPIWSAERFGSLGQLPAKLQARALFDEIDSILENFNEMWQLSRAYSKDPARLSRIGKK